MRSNIFDSWINLTPRSALSFTTSILRIFCCNNCCYPTLRCQNLATHVYWHQVQPFEEPIWQLISYKTAVNKGLTKLDRCPEKIKLQLNINKLTSVFKLIAHQFWIYDIFFVSQQKKHFLWMAHLDKTTLARNNWDNRVPKVSPT